MMSQRRGGDGAFQVREVVPSTDAAYRPFLATSLLIAVAIGFLLGWHVALGRLFDFGDPRRTSVLIQAHGQAQLLGFAGLYVIGLSLRLMPRFGGGSLQLPGLLPLVYWPIVVSVVIRGLVLPWTDGGLHNALLLAAATAAMIGSGSFVLLTAATVTWEARRRDPSGTAFVLGASMLFAANAIATLVLVDEGYEAGALPYLADVAVTQLQLVGFLLVFIVGVGSRALPVMVGREAPRRSAALLPVGLCVAIGLHASALLGLHYGSYSRGLVVLSGGGLLASGVLLLTFAMLAGILRPRANRLRPASQAAMWLVRSAFAWLSLAGALMAYFGLTGSAEQELVSQNELDAIRHSLGAGVVTMLILGMSLLILPEFAAERQGATRQRALAVSLAVMMNLATLLRVAPPLGAELASTATREIALAAAGTLAEVAMLLFAAYLLRLMWRNRPATRSSGANIMR